VLVNATGAWTAIVAETVLRLPRLSLETVQMNQIVVRRLFDTDNVYVFQNSDRRLIFASPYERDFTLIGTVGHPFKGDPAIVSMAAGDVAYLCDAANRYFRERVETSDVVRTVSGVNSVIGAGARGTRRDGSMGFDAKRGKAPLLTIFGGDITTARLRAERVVTKLAQFYPMSPRWTATTPLPGGDFNWAKFEDEVDEARAQWKFLSEPQARRMVAAYGSRLASILGDAREKSDLGPAFGPDLTGAEVRYLMTKEWARFPDDVLWRRSKLGLTMPAADREALAAFMATV
jgi:glycerol-3-phosphate dehydrogenase